MSAGMTQNELYLFQGSFAEMPEASSPPVSDEGGELARLAASVRVDGIRRTAASADVFTDPVIRLYLRLMNAGMPAAVVRSVARVSLSAGRKGRDGGSGRGLSLDEVHAVFEPYDGKRD